MVGAAAFIDAVDDWIEVVEAMAVVRVLVW
jgi:hypothetical protein